MQEEHTQVNELAWNQMAYEAWVNRFGTPIEASQKILADPHSRLGLLDKYFTDVKGKKIINLLNFHICFFSIN